MEKSLQQEITQADVEGESGSPDCNQSSLASFVPIGHDSLQIRGFVRLARRPFAKGVG